MKLGIQQLRAIDFCTDINRRVVSVTGPAGSGKTTIIRQAVESLRGAGRTVVIAAPTGRAARRITEATGYRAVTIHKLLEYGKPEVDDDTGLPKEVTLPARDARRPVEADDIIIDEYAMVNYSLHRDLMGALRKGARLLVFGDVEQLPPIEPHEYTPDFDDSPFQQLLKLPSSVALDIVYRQDQESGLYNNLVRIRHGRPPTKTRDFDILLSETPIKHLLHVVNSIGGFHTMDNQVVVHCKGQELGTHALNQVLQASIGPKDAVPESLPREKYEAHRPIRVHVGDKVICKENIYDLRDFFERYTVWDGDVPDWRSYIPVPESFSILNGDIGIVEDILPDGSIYIQLHDRLVQIPSSYRDYNPRYNNIYTRDPRKKLDLAYAITTHKMQGSECSHVIYLMHRSIAWGLNRNNLYTAVTRAKDHVTLITDSSSLQSCVRYTAAQKEKARRDNKARGTRSYGDTSRETRRETT